jgi:hypothetical protein
MKCNTQSVENDRLASDLAALGYPGFSHLTACSKRNPAEVVLSALQVANLDSRVVEALPWVLLQYPDLDWRWLVREARLNELQNKLGFLTSLARRVAEAAGSLQTTKLLKETEAVLERARLLREETLCHDSLTQAERTWLRSNRSKEAEYWDLLTDLSPDLSHISLNPELESIASRAQRADRKKFDEFLTRVPDVPPHPGDEI